MRKASLSDIDILLRNGLEFVYSIRNSNNKEEFKGHTSEYLQKPLDDVYYSFLYNMALG